MEELQTQRELILQNYDILRSLQRHFRIGLAIKVFWVLVILLPLLWSVIFLPGIIKKYVASFEENAGLPSGLQLPQNLDFGTINELLER
jgi:hypothetical protein